MNLGNWTTAGVVLLSFSASADAIAGSVRQFSGTAAYYSPGYSGRTACGERYDPNKFTAAHRSLPFGTRLRITDPGSQRSVLVVVNDRGPFTKGRVLDLSLAAAKALHMTGRGLMKVTAMIE
ncbi:MAG TPA: septal ring lytic transglycosylase RlpA family protein [Pseudolabrys sp.]|jgi:rare lipoprotein A|nr:septal ring lytic transglycosylase RlpA family protein [Pseudolabrys sp.]